MFLSGEKIEGERCMSTEGSGVNGSSQQSSTSFPGVKGGGPLFSGRGLLITGGLVNDTTPVNHKNETSKISFQPIRKTLTLKFIHRSRNGLST